MRLLAAGVLLLSLVAGCAPARHPRPYDHIFVIVEENMESSGALANPAMATLNRLAGSGGLATQYFGVTHPSEANYVALLGGDTFGIRDDEAYSEHTIDRPSLVDQIEGAALTWRGYFQGLPQPGFDGTCYPANTCVYASKHNAFLNFAHVQSSAAEKANLVPDSQLADDLAGGTTPNLAFIIPDQCHDLHGVDGVCGGDGLAASSDQYLSATVDLIRGSSVWQRGTNALVITFDEGDSEAGCCGATPGGGQIVTIVLRNTGQSGPVRDATPYNHYSLLATLQAAFGLGCQVNGVAVGLTCDATPMAPLFGLR